MDKNSLSWIGGIVVFVVAIFFAIFLITKTNPGKATYATSPDLQPLQNQLITPEALANVEKLTKNGDIPVVVPAENQGKDNPFGG